VTTPPPHLAALRESTHARRIVRELVQRLALPIWTVLDPRGLDPRLARACDRAQVRQLLAWVPELGPSRAARILLDAGLPAETGVRLADLPPGVRTTLANAARNRLAS